MNNYIVTEYSKINNKDILKKLSQPPKSKNGFIAILVLLLDKKINGIEYINSGECNILKHYYKMYNKKKKICVVDEDCFVDCDKVLEGLLSDMDKDVIFWVCLKIIRDDFVKRLGVFVEKGFNNPYVTDISPLYENITPGVALVLKKDDVKHVNMTLNKTYHVLEQYNKNNGKCYLKAKLNKNAVNYLKNTCFSGFVNKKQKEMTGELYVKNVLNINGEFVYIIDVNENSIKHGEEESVNVHPHRYNFHSHPKEAYINNSVKNGWPSLSDYLGFLHLGKNTIFHCVSTLEGLYVLSFGAYWSSRLNEVDKKFISNNFEIDLNDDYTPDKYVQKINNILYKNHPVYVVKYFKWKDAGNVFDVFFPQIGSSCLVTQKIVDNYKKIHIQE
jgi:hypothetical protein